MADGHLIFNTKIDESGFSSGINRLGSIAKGGLGILGGAVAGVTGAMTAGVAAGIKYNASIEQYQTSFEVMTGSAQKAAAVMEELQKIGAETPFETETLAETTQLLMNYGFTADDAIDKMKMLGDISQGSADKMNRIAMAYGQMSSAGKVQLEDVKQMIEAGFNPLQEISESTGESMASLYDRISSGTLAVDEITASMERSTSAGGKYFQSMAKQAETFSGLMSTLKDSAMMMIGTVTQGLFESSKDIVSQGIEAIGQLETAFKEGGAAGMLEAGEQILTNLLQGIASHAPAVIETALSVVGMLASSIGSALPQLIESGIQIITSIIQGMGENGEAIMTKALEIVMQIGEAIISNLPALLTAGLQMIMALAQGLISALPLLIEKVPQLINGFFEALWGFIPQLIGAGLKLIVQLGIGIIQAIPTIIANAGEIVTAILNVMGGISLFKIGKTIITTLGSGLKAMISNVGNIVRNIGNSIKNTFSNFSWGNVGRAIITGIANGISGAAGAIANAARRAARNALNAAKEFLGINSPSRLFRDEVGKYMALGVGVGFEQYMPQQAQEMVKTMDDAVRGVQAAVTGIAPDPVRASSIKATGSESADYVLAKFGRDITNAVKSVGQKPVYLNGRKINQALRMQRVVTA